MIDAIADIARNGLRPDPDITVSEWADQNRVLTGGSEPGPFRTNRAPFIREIADALAPGHPAQRVVFMKGAQVGGTEAGNSWLGFIIAHSPGPVLVVQPTVELGLRFSRQRLDPLIESTPVLRSKVMPARSRDSGNTLLSKEFPGGVIVITGANSAVGLRSMAAKFLFCDECDAYEDDVGGEGSPIALAEARQRTFGFKKKTLLVSTPKFAGRSTIEREYQASDQRRYFVPCPHCDHMQFLLFERLKWTKGKPETAEYFCEECGSSASEADKTDMLARGEWRATAVAKTPACVGFHISSLYSPVGWMSWAEIAADWEKAMTGGVDAMKTFRNTILGETWQERGESPDWERLLERREPFQMGIVPNGAVVLTAAIDNQAAPARLELAVWGWAAGYESWLVDVATIDGDPGGADAWAKVKAIIDAPFPREGGGTMKISAIAVDTGGQHTSSLYNQLRQMRDRRIIPIKGIGGWNRSSPVTGPTMVDVTIQGRKITRGLRLWSVSVDVFKAELYRRLWLTRNEDGSFPAGWVHLPESADAEIIKQLVAEELVTIKDRRGFSRMEWRKLRANESLDCAVMARAALSVLGSDRYGAGFWAKYVRDEVAAVEVEVEATPAPQPVGVPSAAAPPAVAPPAAAQLAPSPKRSLISRFA
jgi:phage terminase large subunit GpA-like protein